MRIAQRNGRPRQRKLSTLSEQVVTPSAHGSAETRTRDWVPPQREVLAKAVCDAALDEGWLYERDDQPLMPLQQAITDLAKSLRHVHFEGDGCLESLDD